MCQKEITQLSFSVLTSVQAPTPSVATLVSAGKRFEMPVLVVGDRKSPIVDWPDGSEFFSLRVQESMNSSLARLLPVDHYCRKNLGYLEAIARGAALLFDTDDDNAPLPHWQPRRLCIEARPIRLNGWVNIYSYFSSQFIWPRGLPLESLQKCRREEVDAGSAGVVECPVQQGIVNGSPDVDALWRLMFDQDFSFNDAPSVWLAPGAWCPFNSQSTWWFKKAFPLLYLPSFVSFRVTDIWRSFIAQRCLWEFGYGVAFHGPESVQRRNNHDLLLDFEEEIPGYLNSNRIKSVLESVQLSSRADKIGDNLHRCYEALISAGIVPSRELPLVEGWLVDVVTCQNTNTLVQKAAYEASSH
jgi:hypothetical protein